MQTILKTFDELNTTELYEILQLRSAVFGVEQNCVYQDLDSKDQVAWHLMGMDEGKLVAYTRIFSPGSFFEQASIGRVVVEGSSRGKKYGIAIMQSSIKAIHDLFGKDTTICISAQAYLLRFYNNLGFHEVGEEYLEDGIPHFKMIRNHSH
jgi:ElaA protein